MAHGVLGWDENFPESDEREEGEKRTGNVCDEYSPGAQDAHCLLEEEDGATVCSWPGTQTVYGRQTVFEAEVYLPASQALHSRSEVAVASFVISWPATHDFAGLHGVVRTGTALKVPGAQAVSFCVWSEQRVG